MQVRAFERYIPLCSNGFIGTKQILMHKKKSCVIPILLYGLENLVFSVCHQVRFNTAYSATETCHQSHTIEILHATSFSFQTAN